MMTAMLKREFASVYEGDFGINLQYSHSVMITTCPNCDHQVTEEITDIEQESEHESVCK